MLPDGSTLQGSEGYTGQATASYENGDKYEGSFADGLRDGSGIYTSRAGSVYKGIYSANKRHGLGTLTLLDGAYYHGHYESGVRQGHGIYRYPNGDVYVGAWSAGMKHGRGDYIFADSQSRLTGDWLDGKISSGGSWRLCGGQSYTGEFKANKPCGKGEWSLSSGISVPGTYTLKSAPIDFAPDSREKPPTLVTCSWGI